MKLLHGFRPTTFLVQNLNLPMLLSKNGLSDIGHQAIGRTRKRTFMQDRLTATGLLPSSQRPLFRLQHGPYEEPLHSMMLR